MKGKEILYKRLRKAEREILFAPPEEAAKIAVKIIKWKGQVFDETP